MPRFDKDYYRVLGVPEDAGSDAIRKAYRAKAKECHPDKAGGDKAKEARFKEINEAHEVLSDPKKRAQYDQIRRGGFQEGVGGDADDFFRSVMDLGAWGRRDGARPMRERGDDVAFVLDVPFETAARGGRLTVDLPRDEACETCSGSGLEGELKPCRACKGSGSATRAQGGFAFSRPCPTCMGSGHAPAPPCPACGGEGARAVTRKLEVKIPPGVSTGSRLRLAGEGGPGRRGGPPGDCLLELRVGSHPDFERDGSDLTSHLELDFTDAILGVQVPVKTLHGTVTLKVPPGTQPGSRLRLAGQGIQAASGEPGDHYVRIKVRLPRDLTEAQRTALEAFRPLPKS